MSALIKSAQLMVFAVCIFVVLACGSNTKSPPTETPIPLPTEILTPMPTPTPEPVIRVVPSGAPLESTELFVEVHQQDNCGVPSTATSTFANAESIHYTVELGAGVTVDAKGEISIPGFTKVAVGAAVATHYKVEYGGQETETFSLQLQAPANTRVDHTLHHLQLWDTGTVIVTVLGQDLRYQYRFPRGYRIEKKSIELQCPTTPVSAAPMIAPTSVPAIASTAAATLIGGTPIRCIPDGVIGHETANPLYKVPPGYRSGWITSDPSDITLPDGTMTTILERYVLVVIDIPEVQIRNVAVGSKHSNTWGCWFHQDLSDKVLPAAQDELRKMKSEAPTVTAGLYQLDNNGLIKLE